MAKKHSSGLSKTARVSLGIGGTSQFRDHLTNHIDPKSGKPIMLSQLLPVKVMQNGRTFMTYYSKDTYRSS